MNPASLPPYSEQMYLDQRFQLLRAAGAHPSHPHAALYPPLGSPYASHLYSMIPSAALGLGPSLHERIKLEEEHRARAIAREEEREREMQREKERELREQREREQREKEQREREREREQREKEQREKEQKEKEAREREMREKEREARERQQLLSASHHYANPLYNPLSRNLLGSMIPHLNLGLRAPPAGLHGLSGMSPYHAAANQRQSPHGAMGLPGLGLPGLTSMSHANLPHHLQQAALGLSPAGLGHPGFSAAALGLAHHSMNLSHPHMSPHHPAITSSHQLPPHSTSMLTSTAGSGSGSPHTSLNIVSSTAPMQIRHSESNSITSLAPTIQSTSTSIAQPTSSLSTHMSSMSNSALYYPHPSHLAAMHAAAAASLPTSQSPHSLPPLPLPVNPTAFSTSIAAGKLTPTTPVSSTNTQNGGNKNAQQSPHAMRHHIVNVVPQATAMDKPSNSTGVSASTHEPTTLDLTGSNSNSSNHAPSTVSNSESIRPSSNMQMTTTELNGLEANNDNGKDQEDSTKTDTHSSEKKTAQSPSTTTNTTLASKDNEDTNAGAESNRRHGSSPAGQGKQHMGNEAKMAGLIAQQQMTLNEISSQPASPLHMEGGKNSKLTPPNPSLTTTTTNSTNPNITLKTQTDYQQPMQSTTPNPQTNIQQQSSPSTPGGPISTSANPPPRSNQTLANNSNSVNQSPEVVSTTGVTSTTSGTTSPPVVSSSTNVAGSSPQTNFVDEAAVSSATPTTTSVQAEMSSR